MAELPRKKSRMAERFSIFPPVYFLLFVTFHCGGFGGVYTGNAFFGQGREGKFHKSVERYFGYVAVIDASILLI